MAKKPTMLGGNIYPGRAELKAAVQEYVRTAPMGTPLRDSFPYAIFDRHPHRQEKTGPGLRHIEIRFTEYGNRGFYAVRTDGTAIDFSWQVALDFTKSGATLERAAREAIRGQIEAVALPGPEWHAHHDGKSFRQILNEWMETLGGRVPDLIHGDLHDYFRDPADAESWRAFHLRNAVLKVMSVDDHKEFHRLFG